MNRNIVIASLALGWLIAAGAAWWFLAGNASPDQDLAPLPAADVFYPSENASVSPPNVSVHAETGPGKAKSRASSSAIGLAPSASWDVAQSAEPGANLNRVSPTSPDQRTEIHERPAQSESPARPRDQMSLPVALLIRDPTVNSTPQQQQALAKIQNDFINAVGGSNQDPADPAYQRRWASAQEIADERFRAEFGWDAFNQFSRQRYLAELNGQTSGVNVP